MQKTGIGAAVAACRLDACRTRHWPPTPRRLEAALQRQESQRLVGALRLEDSRRCAAGRGSLFAVENGEIHAYPTQAAGSEQPNAYLETNAEFSDYVISLEYQWGEKKFAPRLEPGARRRAHLSRASRAPGRLAGGHRGADPGR